MLSDLCRVGWSPVAGHTAFTVNLREGSDGFEMLPSATIDDMRDIVLRRSQIASVTADQADGRKGDDFISASSIVRIEPDVRKQGAAVEAGAASATPRRAIASLDLLPSSAVRRFRTE